MISCTFSKHTKGIQVIRTQVNSFLKNVTFSDNAIPLLMTQTSTATICRSMEVGKVFTQTRYPHAVRCATRTPSVTTSRIEPNQEKISVP